MAAAEFHTLQISDLRRETDETVSLAFAVPPTLADTFRFVPGQYLTLRNQIDGADIRRAYSICSSPQEGELRVAIRHVTDGRFSSFANRRLKAGETLSVLPPQGRFIAPPVVGRARHFLGIAAGSGITPVYSILKDLLEREPHSRFTLFYGNRLTRAILFREELESLKNRFMTRFALHHILSREASDVSVLHGRLDGARIAALLPTLGPPAAIGAVFLCGPADMIVAARSTLSGAGIAQGRIHAEMFTPAADVVARPPALVEAGSSLQTAHVQFDGRRHAIPVSPGENIIDAAARAGLELPFSCKGGMCCTCRAKLVSGKVEMVQNFSLEPWEVQAGFVLACQAVPVTLEVALDFDQV